MKRVVVAGLALAVGCFAPAASRSPSELMIGRAALALYDPPRDLGPLFPDVQLSGIFEVGERPWERLDERPDVVGERQRAILQVVSFRAQHSRALSIAECRINVEYIQFRFYA